MLAATSPDGSFIMALPGLVILLMFAALLFGLFAAPLSKRATKREQNGHPDTGARKSE